MSRDISSIL